jgi:hypothetical protein
MKRCARTPSLLLSLTVAAGLSGCSTSDGLPEPPGAGNPPGTLAEPLDYHRDAKALLDRYCTDCHQPGGIAPFSLTSYAAAKAQASQIAGAIVGGSMPPWMPSDNGAPLLHSRKLRPEDRATLLSWIAQGAPEGDPQAASRIVLPPADKVEAPRPDILADMGVTYQPNTKLTDDYRCFVIDPGLTAERYLRAVDVKPGNRRLVHHVILFEVPAAAAAKVRMKDAAEDGPGYTCFGGAGSNSAQMVAGWAPGGVPTRLRDDEGILLRKGSLLVMQVHYNNRQNDGQGDRTVATLELLADKPAHQLVLLPVARPDQLMIKAGDPNAQQLIAVPVSVIMSYAQIGGSELVLSGSTPHMHTLGKRVVTSVNDSPLLEIPHWDFHWQQAYQFQQPVSLRPTDTLVVECDYDNSFANQPIVDGQKQMPRDVTWGENTSDEMCISFLHVRMPTPAM